MSATSTLGPESGRGTQGLGLDADVAVVGLGALGSAAAWQLARRGARVVGLEQFRLGHDRGASHGDSRIIRLSYHTPGYIRAAQQAYRDWAELDAGLVLQTGGVDLFPPGAAIDEHEYEAAMAECGVAYPLLDEPEARRRWPGLHLPPGTRVRYQQQTGIVAAAPAVAALQQAAIATGARLVAQCPVAEVRDAGSHVELHCADGSLLRAGSVVVAADAWTNRVLAGLGVTLPLTVTKEHAVHFAAAGTDPHGRGGPLAPGAFPVWIWMTDPSWYGFPAFGEASVKVGQDCGGEPVDPDARDFLPDPAYVSRMADFVRQLIPGAGDVLRVTTCLYTLTPDRDFVLGPVPGHERVLVAQGAAHGFKFAPWFGRVLADLALTGRTDQPIAGFEVDRPALSEPSTPARGLV